MYRIISTISVKKGLKILLPKGRHIIEQGNILRRNLLWGAVSLLLVTLAIQSDVSAAPINIYWTDRDNGQLFSNDLQGGGNVQVTSGFGRLQDVDLDSGTGTLYFADWGPVGFPGGQGSINKVNLDGTGLGTVLSTGDAVHQLALDTANNQLYFTRAVSYDGREISKVNLDGTGYTPLLTGAGWFPSGLALDSTNSKLYWGDIGVVSNPFNGAVNSMNLDGTSPTTLSPHVNGQGRGFALDESSGIIYSTAHNPCYRLRENVESSAA